MISFKAYNNKGTKDRTKNTFIKQKWEYIMLDGRLPLQKIYIYKEKTSKDHPTSKPWLGEDLSQDHQPWDGYRQLWT